MKRILTLCLSIIFVSVLVVVISYSQEPTNSGNVQNITKVSDIHSFWAMTQLSGGIGYVIMAVLAIGLFLLFLKVIELVVDWSHSKKLRSHVFANMHCAALEQTIQNHVNSILGQTLNHILSFYRAKGSSVGAQDELVTVIDEQYESFDTFKGRLNFLSDTAGALGLLGTVWGVFLTFFGGSLDSEKILNGMGVALITTLLGLVVSLIINLGATEITSLFNKRLKVVKIKADELRLQLLKLDRLLTSENVSLAPPEDKQEFGKKSVPSALPGSLALMCDLNVKEIGAGESLADALVLRVCDAAGTPFANADIALAIEGAAFFKNRQQQIHVRTNKKGEATVTIYGQDEPGTAIIYAWLHDRPEHRTSRNLVVVPSAPAKMQIIAGNDQAATTEMALHETLKVAVTDRFGNPAPGVEVIFEVGNGQGKFATGNHSATIKTDNDGFAATNFTLGNKPGFHTIQAMISNNRKVAPVEFRILAKEDHARS